MAKKIFTDESLVTLVDETKSYVDSAVSTKANSSHTHSISNVTNLQSSLDAKVPTSRTVNGKALSSNITLSASDVGAAASSHTHSSYVNQNAFSNVKVGSTTVSADTTTDTLEIVAGAGISVAGDATNDKVTITNSGVRSIASGSTNGTISVNTNGTAADVAVKGLAAAAYKAVTDSSSASAISTGTSLVTERDVYYGLPKINNSNSYTRSTTIYAPTAGGKSGYVLVGAGTTTAPTWKSLSGAGIAAASHTHDYLPLSGGTLSGELYFSSSAGITFDAYGSVIEMSDVNGSCYEVMRMGGESDKPTLILGDGLYTRSIGVTNVSAGTKVQLITKNDRLILESVSATGYTGYLHPETNGTCTLGTASRRFKQLYATTATINTSDEREKNNITAIADYPSIFSEGNALEILFNRLVPKTYYLNLEEDSPELHIGFVAQDVASILEELGMSEDELGLLQHDYWTDEETGEEKDAYGLRYEEFIALNTYVLQKLISEKDDMKRRLDRIEEALGISLDE